MTWITNNSGGSSEYIREPFDSYDPAAWEGDTSAFSTTTSPTKYSGSALQATVGGAFIVHGTHTMTRGDSLSVSMRKSDGSQGYTQLRTEDFNGNHAVSVVLNANDGTLNINAPNNGSSTNFGVSPDTWYTITLEWMQDDTLRVTAWSGNGGGGTHLTTDGVLDFDELKVGFGGSNGSGSDTITFDNFRVGNSA